MLRTDTLVGWLNALKSAGVFPRFALDRNHGLSLPVSSIFKRLFLAPLLLIGTMSLSACDWDDLVCALTLDEVGDCEDDPPTTPAPGPVESLLADINSFKQQIALGAGNQSIALRAFQTAEVGDIWIRNSDDDSLQNHIGNVTAALALNENDTTRFTRDLNSLGVEIEWNRSYRESMDVGFEFANAALRAAFAYGNAARMTLRITVIDASLHQFLEPATIYDQYLDSFGDNEIKGNILLTGVLRGKLRIEFTVYNSDNQILDISGRVMATNINNAPGISAGYAVESASSTYYGAVEESFEDSSVFAATYLKISPSKQDQLFISQQLADDLTSSFVKRLPVFDKTTGLAIAQFEIHQERTGSGADEEIRWFLTVKNVSQPQISYFLFYYLTFSNISSEFLFVSQGTIQRLDPGEERNLGQISEESTLLKFVTVDPEGTTYTQL